MQNNNKTVVKYTVCCHGNVLSRCRRLTVLCYYQSIYLWLPKFSLYPLPALRSYPPCFDHQKEACK